MEFDAHFWILILIILLFGAFGGALNYFHNFDTVKNEEKNSNVLWNYLFLGIGSAVLVPAFLKMIASDLISGSDKFDNLNYLIFAGFCLIAAIFSRRFINTIGERILEAAKQAEKTSNQAKKDFETAKLELTSTQERIEDVKLAVNLRNFDNTNPDSKESEKQKLVELANSYIEKTSIPDYTDRIRMKAELGRKMGQIIVKNGLDKEELFQNYPIEGMYLAIAYSVELKPEEESFPILKELSGVVSQLYTKSVLLVAFRTMTSSGFVTKEQAQEIGDIIKKFKNGADKPLMRNIEDTLNVVRFVNPDI